MRVEDVAGHVGGVLGEEFGSSILAVGWYDADADPPYGTVYVGNGDPLESDSGVVLDGCLRESLDRQYHDRAHGEALEATLRVYESVLDVDLPVSRHAGIVVSIVRDDFQLVPAVISLAQTVSAVEFGISL